MNGLTHASWFSGVGGLDLGLERAGWRTVSFSEVDPYACAVLAQRWPGVRNLGSITAAELHRSADCGSESIDGSADDWPHATLWSGGFPCTDLSVAGRRRGLRHKDGSLTRSGLAFAFLVLVERHGPPLILLENVPGLLSSHGGRDMAALCGAMVELGYGVAYRVLDARYFGVPQRRRRVFIVGVRSGDDDPDGHLAAYRAASVLAVGTRCRRHPATGHEAGEEATAGVGDGIVGTLESGANRTGGTRPPGTTVDTVDTLVVDRPPTYPDRVRAPDGLARRLDGGSGLAVNENQRGEFRMTALTDSVKGTGGKPGQGYQAAVGHFGLDDTPPDGLDSHRYRCCGNGVVAPVAEWLGRRLARVA